MGCPNPTMIGISGHIDRNELVLAIEGIVHRLVAEQDGYHATKEILKQLHVALSSEALQGGKGNLWVIAGEFNYVNFEQIAELAAPLSKELDCEVLVWNGDDVESIHAGRWWEGKLISSVGSRM
jgi:hypothetical protein